MEYGRDPSSWPYNLDPITVNLDLNYARVWFDLLCTQLQTKPQVEILCVLSSPDWSSMNTSPGMAPFGTSSMGSMWRGDACWRELESWWHVAWVQETSGTQPPTLSMHAPCCRWAEHSKMSQILCKQIFMIRCSYFSYRYHSCRWVCCISIRSLRPSCDNVYR